MSGGRIVSGSHGTPALRAPMDDDSEQWLRGLQGPEPERTKARELLHAKLLRIARAELARRAPRVQIAGPEIDDLAHQAAADALLAIIAKLPGFRGDSRFVTWAYKFVILEVSTKLGRHFWRRPGVRLDVEDWDRIPGRFGADPADRAEWQDLVVALRRAVDGALTAHQRKVFVSLVLTGVPMDALAADLGTNRNAIYKVMFDARRKLRAALVANGYLDEEGTATT